MESQDYTTRSGSLKRSSSFKKLLKLPNWASSSSSGMCLNDYLFETFFYLKIIQTFYNNWKKYCFG